MGCTRMTTLLCFWALVCGRQKNLHIYSLWPAAKSRFCLILGRRSGKALKHCTVEVAGDVSCFNLFVTQ